QISQGQVEYVLNRLLSPTGNRGLLAFHGTRESHQQLAATRFASERFFTSLHVWLAEHAGHDRATRSQGLRIRQPEIVQNPLSEELQKLGSAVLAIVEKIELEEEQIELASAAARVLALAQGSNDWLAQALPGQVYWLETRGER